MVAPQEFFSPIAFDFLWEAMRIGELPYPLQVPSHGATEDERILLRRSTNAELVTRGVRDPQGRLEPHVEQWLRLLARPAVSIDALHIPEYRMPPVAILAASDGREAVIAIQDHQGIRVRPAYPDGLASEVVSLLPAGPRGSESSITLPLDEAMRTAPARTMAGVGAAREAEAADKGGRWGRSRRERSGLAERTTDPREAYGRLSGQPRLRGGQIAANSRDHLGGKRRSPVLAWFDTAGGRYLSLSRPGPDGREWVTISPADAKTLRSRLGEMVGGVATAG
ncbi:ESX secretion-associated protein EspG [Amycolatopsis antarctica]|uniref:ESX secretion-associated protein EspG n=1 Tax=Amycolatopsis antarctica TaxID=1854586 RepID=A0A263CXR5_9PSEU|nr:ESX secretion-associated protein EspG [Amycolatopsis antarctica]OZM70891.1 ESX secretion-associated protein EspG [Amycolatopsis antarctica]